MSNPASKPAETPILKTVRKLPLIRCLTTLTACVVLGGAAGAAQAATVGTLPPRNPASDCNHASVAGGYWGVTDIDSCRVLEGVGPLTLPTNWRMLTPVEQGFVLINLERVNRGLAPIVGLSSALNQLASQGAANGVDPSFPSGGFNGGGAIWADAGSALAADYMWMYDDGPQGLDSNIGCPAAGGPGCWGHRDIILWNKLGGPLVAGGGYSQSGGDGGSFSYVVLSGYSTANLTFTWSSELQYFAAAPTVEPTGRVTAATILHRRKGVKPEHKPAKHKPGKRRRTSR
jgi:hypothetical protein